MGNLKNKKFTPSFYKLYPDIKDEEEIAVKFLEDYLEHNRSISALSRKFDMNRRTITTILKDIEVTPAFKNYVNKFANRIKDFADPTLNRSLYARYEIKLQEFSRKVAKYEKEGNTPLAKEYDRMILSMLGKMAEMSSRFLLSPSVREALNKPTEPKTPSDVEDELSKLIKDAELEDKHNKLEGIH